MEEESCSRKKLFYENCSPVFTEYRLMREFVLFQQQNLSNIYVVPSNGSPFKWFGVVFIHHGLYQGAILRFTLLIPRNYPSHELPKLYFEPVPFHPLVNPKTGELNLKRAFPSWRANVNQIWQVILCAKKIFYSLEKDMESEEAALPSPPFHEEAVKLFKEDLSEFLLRVAQTVAECHARLYEPPNESSDNNVILFLPWNPEIHEELRQKLLTSGGPSLGDEVDGLSSAHGLSWVQKGSTQTFSKTVS